MNYLVVLLFCSIAVASKYTCSKSDCYECIGDTCHLTCLGKDCSTCPSGDCCNGVNCNVCISSICCSTSKCNRCIQSNRRTCHKETSDCDDLIQEKCELSTLSDQPLETEYYAGNYAGNLHNITTIIKLRNVINNTNAIAAPILVNLTQVNDVELNGTGTGGIGYPGFINTNATYRNKNCCAIVHPQECHKVSQLPNKICFTRKHRECSDLCNNGTNLLIKVATGGPSKCIVIASHPYYYCGYYTTEDCSACYNCEKQNKLECLQNSSCSDACRTSVFPRKFYNVPYYIKNSNESSSSNGLPPAQK